MRGSGAVSTLGALGYGRTSVMRAWALQARRGGGVMVMESKAAWSPSYLNGAENILCVPRSSHA